MRTGVQTEFINGRIVAKTILTTRETMVACYILVNAQEGYTLRMIIEKLPQWIKHKNNIKEILIKLEKTGIMTMRDSIKGKRINEISEKAENAAGNLIMDLEKCRLSLNDSGNDNCNQLNR